MRLLSKKKKTGRGHVSWKYFQYFDEIFEKDLNINPTIRKIDSFSKPTCVENSAVGSSSSGSEHVSQQQP